MRTDSEISNPPENRPPWLTFVSRADNDFAWLRLMVINPMNGAVSTLVEETLDPDAQINPPDASGITIDGL